MEGAELRGWLAEFRDYNFGVTMNKVLLVAFALLLAAASCSRKPALARPDRAKWNAATLAGDYDRLGHKSSQWDENAKQALAEYAIVMAGEASGTGSRRGVVGSFADAARQAGCDDPLIEYLRCRYSPPPDSGELVRSCCKAADDLQASDYADIRKFYANLHAADIIRGHRNPEKRTAENEQINKYLSLAYNDLLRTTGDRTVPPAEVYQACVTFVDYGNNRESWLSPIHDRVEVPLLASWPGSSLPHLFQGYYYTEYAWFARGSGPASAVSDENWKLFFARLTEAEKDLKQGWSLDHSDAQIPTLMLTVAMGQQKKRPDMEVWFKRAMSADTNNYEACKRKLRFLSPQWYGTPEDMLAFGHECVESKHWGGGVPLVLMDAHRELAKLSGDDAAERAAYWLQPGVWPDVKASYERFFQLNPAAVSTRQNYAYYAARCREWDAFNEQVKIIEANPGIDYSFWGGKEAFDKFVQDVREHVDPSPAETPIHNG